MSSTHSPKLPTTACSTSQARGNGSSANGTGSSPPTTGPTRFVSLTTPQQVERTKFKVLSTTLAANICYLIGAGGFVIFGVFEYKNRCPDFVGAEVWYLLGFVGFLVSGFVELFVDIFQDVKSLSRSRYNRKYFWSNVLISLLFTAGNVFDLASFFLWHSQNFRLESAMLYTASHTWLVMSIIALATSFHPSIFTLGDAVMQMDAVGNWLFFFGNVLDVVARYFAKLTERQTKTVYGLEVISSVLWFINALLFVGADSIRLYTKMIFQTDHLSGNRGTPTPTHNKSRTTASAAIPSTSTSPDIDVRQSRRRESQGLMPSVTPFSRTNVNNA